MNALILHPTKRHPLTGRPLEAVGVRRDGRPIWPILGGDDTVPPAGASAQPAAPQRPDGVTEEEWNALGDPGKAAIVREREARQEAERQLAAARARPTPPAKSPDNSGAGQQQSTAPAQTPATSSPAAGADQQDIAAIVQQAVQAAIAPFQQAEEERRTQEAAQAIQATVKTAAKDILHDPSDALVNIDLTKVVNEQGQADPQKVTAELEELVKRKPYLAKSGPRFAPPGIGGGAPAATTDAEKVKAVLADMQKATGVRLPTPN